MAMQVHPEDPGVLAKIADLNLSFEEIERYRRKFNAIDLNKDGIITLREMYAISKVMGYRMSIHELMVCINIPYMASILYFV